LVVIRLNIVIGIPAYNEEEKIGKLVSELKKKFTNIVVCDDGSTDATSQIAKNSGAIVINHDKNSGYGVAIRSIFLKAKEMDADTLVTFDADGQHRVEDIDNVLEPILSEHADIVIGSRFMNGKNQQIPEYRKIGIKALTKVANVSLNEKITDSQSGFRAYNKKVLSEIIPSDSGMGVSTEILIKASKSKFKIVEVPITVLYGGDTSTHNPISHGTSVMLSTLKYTAIEHPLKFYGIPGIILLGIGLFFVLWTIQYYGEFRVFHLTLAAIAIGTTIFGLVALTTAILLFSLVSVIRESKN
jgi:glycosyltransferase involved in cell wall biosynthesis